MSRIWPTADSFPQLQNQDTVYWEEGSIVESGNDVGVPKRRLRATTRRKGFRTTLELSGLQLTAFWTFWETTLSNGILDFDWENPIDDTSITVQFAGKSASKPQFRLKTGSKSVNYRRWYASLDFEIV